MELRQYSDAPEALPDSGLEPVIDSTLEPVDNTVPWGDMTPSTAVTMPDRPTWIRRTILCLPVWLFIVLLVFLIVGGVVVGCVVGLVVNKPSNTGPRGPQVTQYWPQST